MGNRRALRAAALLLPVVMVGGMLVTLDAGTADASGSLGLPALSSISLAPTVTSIVQGQTQQFTATGLLSNGTVQTITSALTWSASSPSVATVSPTGFVNGLSAGVESITATAPAGFLGLLSPLTGTATLDVLPVLSSITVTPSVGSLTQGQTQQLTATGLFSNGTIQTITNDVTWSSATSTLASVSNTGLATGLLPGADTITATAPAGLLTGPLAGLPSPLSGAASLNVLGGSATGNPACTFSGSLGNTPLVLNVTPGGVVDIACKGLSSTTPYLLVETSLLLAVDPAAKALLTGQATSVPGLLSLVNALPEINAASEAFPVSDSSGSLDYDYTVPTTQALDPNATCPPTTKEFNSGLIGCAVAMINLSTFDVVDAGTFLLHYKTDASLFPPNPTLALSTNAATVGQTVSISDAPAATTYWWMATLTSLYALLDGGTAGASTVTVKVGNKKAVSDASVVPASYSGGVFSPPKLSGTFVVPKARRGKKKVLVQLTGTLLGIPLSNSLSQKMKVSK